MAIYNQISYVQINSERHLKKQTTNLIEFLIAAFYIIIIHEANGSIIVLF